MTDKDFDALADECQEFFKSPENWEFLEQHIEFDQSRFFRVLMAYGAAQVIPQLVANGLKIWASSPEEEHVFMSLGPLEFEVSREALLKNLESGTCISVTPSVRLDLWHDDD